jgi:hypothetical protein
MRLPPPIVAAPARPAPPQVTFTAPPNLGTFVVRAYATVGASGRYGSGEGRLVVRRTLSLTPSVPRFVRVGDTFEAGAVVTVESAPATVNVSVTVSAVVFWGWGCVVRRTRVRRSTRPTRTRHVLSG